MTPHQTLRMVAMEDRLAADRDGTYLASLVAGFSQQQTVLERALAAGLAPGDFDAAQRLSRALTAATAVVRRVWQMHHEKS